MLKKLLISTGVVLALFTIQLAPAAFASQQVTRDIQNAECAGSNLELSDYNNPNSNCSNSFQQIDRIIRHFVNILSAIVGVVAVIMIIVGGFRYVTSGGNDTSITSAKNTILYAIVGLIIVALAQVLVHFVLRNLANS